MYQYVNTIKRKTNKPIWYEGDYYDIGCSAITQVKKFPNIIHKRQIQQQKIPWPKGHKNDIGRSSIPNGNFNLFLGAVWA